MVIPRSLSPLSSLKVGPDPVEVHYTDEKVLEQVLADITSGAFNEDYKIMDGLWTLEEALLSESYGLLSGFLDVALLT